MRNVRNRLTGVAERSRWTMSSIMALLVLAGSLPRVRADFVVDGNVDPADPSTWTSTTWCHIGNTSNGSLTINADSDLRSMWAYIGNNAGVTGVATVTGTGSTWNSYLTIGESGTGTLNITGGGAVGSNSSFGTIGNQSGSVGVVTVDGTGSSWTNSNLHVAGSGTGTLNITNGGAVSVTGSTFIARRAGSSGTIHFGPGGGTLTTKSLYFSLPTQLTGAGTIMARGLVSDLDLVFDSTASLHQSRTFDGVILDLDLASDPSTNGDLGAGYRGAGSISIQNGVTVRSAYGYLGYESGSTGVSTVDGTGSTWLAGRLYIGLGGNGTLNVTNSGTVSTSNLYVGTSGNGTLNLSNGGAVFVTGTTYVASQTGSSGAIHFGPGGGALSTKSLFAAPNQVTGAGTIDARGLVSDINLVFDSSASLTKTLSFDNVAVTLDMGTDPSTNGDLGAGYKSHASLTIQDGITVNSTNGYLGYSSSAMGTATVSGTGSTWRNTGSLYVGYSGSGTLDIVERGAVSNATGYIGSSSGATGIVNVTGSGSSWTSSGSLNVGYSGNGTLNISRGGAVSSGYGNIGYGPDGKAIGSVTVDGLGSTWTNSGNLSIGSHGSGTLHITGGGAVSSGSGWIGSMSSDAIGVVTVKGSGSTWTNSGDLYVGGMDNNGTLNITSGGTVSSGPGTIGYLSTSRPSAATVDGIGSRWTSSGSLTLGNYGCEAALNISGGGIVTATSALIGSNAPFGTRALLAIDVGNDSRFDVGTGTLANYGKVRLLAGAGATAGDTFTPITAGTWSGSGTYQAVGGTWNSGTHQFTASLVQAGMAGDPIAIDLHDKQRVMVIDGGTGKVVGASFLAKESSTPLTFTASIINGTPINTLQDLIGGDQSILGAWQFTADDGYTPGDPAYLSFNVGTGHDRDLLRVWHYDGASWITYAAPDLTCNGPYAGFTVTGFSGYAITTPEPGTLALLLTAAVAAMGFARRRK
jgi:T5SS/PEP-CTERM-associated repeat protein